MRILLALLSVVAITVLLSLSLSDSPSPSAPVSLSLARHLLEEAETTEAKGSEEREEERVEEREEEREDVKGRFDKYLTDNPELMSKEYVQKYAKSFEYIDLTSETPLEFRFDKYCRTRRRPQLDRGLSVSLSPPIPSKRVAIFSINSGRSGSNFLAELFGRIGNVAAFHEMQPDLCCTYMQNRKKSGLLATFTQRLRKASRVEFEWRKVAKSKGILVETSHTFAKDAWDVLMCHFGGYESDKLEVQFIHLRRYLPDVIYSQMRVGFREHHLNWYYMYTDDKMLAIKEFARLPEILGRTPDEYDEVIAYMIDTEAHRVLFQRRFPNLVIHEISLEALQNATECQRWIEEVVGTRLTPREIEGVLASVGKPVNVKSGEKAHKPGVPVEREIYIWRRIAEFLKKCEEYGVPLPKLPQLWKWPSTELNELLINPTPLPTPTPQPTSLSLPTPPLYLSPTHLANLKMRQYPFPYARWKEDKSHPLRFDYSFCGRNAAQGAVAPENPQIVPDIRGNAMNPPKLRGLLESESESTSNSESESETLPYDDVHAALSNSSESSINYPPPNRLYGQQRYRVIYTMHPGRSGSGFLRRLLGSSEGLLSTQEDIPDLHGTILMRVRVDGLSKTMAMRASSKGRVLNSRVEKSAQGGKFGYADTTHMFLKNIWDVAMCSFRNRAAYDVRVIHLQRHLPSVVLSLKKLGFRALKNHWYYNFKDKKMLAIPEFADLEKILKRPVTELDEIISYVLDMEAHAHLFRLRFPHIPVVAVRPESLSASHSTATTLSSSLSPGKSPPTSYTAEAAKLFKALDIPLSQMDIKRISEVVGELSQQSSSTNPSSPDRAINKQMSKAVFDVQTQMYDFITRCVEAGVRLPPLPHLKPWDPMADSGRGIILYPMEEIRLTELTGKGHIPNSPVPRAKIPVLPSRNPWAEAAEIISTPIPTPVALPVEIRGDRDIFSAAYFEREREREKAATGKEVSYEYFRAEREGNPVYFGKEWCPHRVFHAEARRDPYNMVFAIHPGPKDPFAAHLNGAIKTISGVLCEVQSVPDMCCLPWNNIKKNGRSSEEFTKRALQKGRALDQKIIASRAFTLKAGVDRIPTFVDLNHLFIKSFWDVAACHLRSPTDELFHGVRVAHLQWYLPYAVYTLQQRNFGSNVVPHYYGSDDVSVLAVKAFARLDDVLGRPADLYDEIIAYVIDTHAQRYLLQRRFPTLPIVDVRAEIFGVDVGYTEAVLGKLGIEVLEGDVGRLEWFVKSNPIDIPSDSEISYIEYRMADFLERCREREISLPPLPSLMKYQGGEWVLPQVFKHKGVFPSYTPLPTPLPSAAFDSPYTFLSESHLNHVINLPQRPTGWPYVTWNNFGERGVGFAYEKCGKILQQQGARGTGIERWLEGREKPMKMIYVLNSGRSGSSYLHKLLDATTFITAYHEQAPDMHGTALLRTKRSGLESTFSQRSTLKVRRTESSLMSAVRQKGVDAWADTTHLFLKNFWDVIMCRFGQMKNLDIRIIVLRRYLPDVLHSHLRLGFRGLAREWYYTYTDKGMLAIPELAHLQKILKRYPSETDEALTYLLDTEAHSQLFLRRFSDPANPGNPNPNAPNVHVIETRLEELEDMEGVEKLMKGLGMEEQWRESSESRARVEEIVGRPSNMKSASKHSHPGTEERESRKLLEYIREFLEKCRESGVYMPTLPQLEKLEVHTKP